MSEKPQMSLWDRWQAMNADELRQECHRLFCMAGYAQGLMYDEHRNLQRRIAEQRKNIDALLSPPPPSGEGGK